jgi:predicted O-linked N-acetylglucosamine transferase (SPINDLY family)
VAPQKKIMAPTNDGVLLRQAESALSQGQLKQAALLCRQLLARDARNIGARYFLALTHAVGGEVDIAIEHWQQVLQVDPENFLSLANLGSALAQQGRHRDAAARLREALRLDGSQAQVHYNLANSLLALGELESSIASYRSALSLQPGFAEARNNLGVAYRQTNRLPEACAEFAAALGVNPGLVDAKENLESAVQALYAAGVQQHRSGRLGAAVSSYDTVLAHRPRMAAVWRDRGRALESLQRLSGALESYRKAVALTPSDAGAIAGILSCSVRICEWPLAADSLQKLRALPDGLEAIHPFLALSVCERPQEQLRIANRRAQSLLSASPPAVSQRGLPTHDSTSPQERRLRLAYVSSDFRDHAVAHLLVGVLEQHDRERFEVHAVSLQPEDRVTDIGRRLRKAVDRYHDVSAMPDADAVGLLRDLSIDIAVDLNSYTIGGRPEIFAGRGAPVQVSYLGYAGTSGAPFMDYLIADAVAVPSTAEQYFSERIWRLPHCFLPNDDRREVGSIPTRAQAGLPGQGLVLCAFTNAYKINAPVFDVWMRLLRGVPASVLWLRSMATEARENLQREARMRGVDPERLVFAPHVPSMAEHLGRQSLADIYLDTWPYNAHSTTCDALWSGVPVLTCAGESFASRVAASALTAVGLPELITRSIQDYEQKALELLQHPERLQTLRARLAQLRVESPLFDTVGYCRNLEEAYRTMYERAQGVS